MKRIWTYILYRFRKVRLPDVPEGFITLEEVEIARKRLLKI